MNTPIKVQLIVVKIAMIFMNLRAKVTLFAPKQFPIMPQDDYCTPSGTDKNSDIWVVKMGLAVGILTSMIQAMNIAVQIDIQVEQRITTEGREIFRYSPQPLKATILFGRKARLTFFAIYN